ncbi:MAG TPA: MG2 domain-containing protein [Blastocatellia bacterium]|nr:MG2 domain-containing protein [Blastocatellia bacterium]
MTQDLPRSSNDLNLQSLLGKISFADRQRVENWSIDTGDKGDHVPGQKAVRLPNKLPTGAYALVTTGRGAQTTYELLLVTDATLVIKTSPKQLLAYFCNAIDGSPIANAKVKALSYGTHRDNNQAFIWDGTKQTNSDGIAVFDLPSDQNYSNVFVAAEVGQRQAFASNYVYRYNTNQKQWRIYATTDRPAYRPKETVQWKFIARQYDGEVYSTPENQTIKYQINDARGSKVKEDTVTLNGFGSAWGSFDLAESLPLGMYTITFWNDAHSSPIGSAQLFRLEEYKLPEFKVSVKTPEENGKRKTFRLGESVETKIQADYYFGGPVSNANVEVLVYQNPYYHYYFPYHEYAWFYEDFTRYNYYYGNGTIIKRETLKTDATGSATLTFDTPVGAGQDFEYRIEARVTDSSRREIIGSNTVRVTRQRYYVHPNATHNIYRPQDKVTVDLKAIDANDQPVQVEGKVKITRDFWEEIWIDPSGKEVSGRELERLRSQSISFPPPAVGGKGWQIKVRQYQHDDIATVDSKTDAEGNAQVSFIAPREGYYRVAWRSVDKSGMPITGETAVWVANNTTTDLGYRAGLDIIIDKDTFRPGQSAPVMLTSPVSDRYALFSVEADDLYSYQVVHITGTAKLIEVPLSEKDTPNIFLTAAMVSQGKLFLSSKQVVIPPVNQFLNVEVKADRDQYQPREEGSLAIKTTDQNGKPVSTEVALGLTDESVYYIQQNLAGDLRQFYYGTKRAEMTQTTSTLQQKGYVKLVEDSEKQLFDDLAMKDEKRRDGGIGAGQGAGVGGGVMNMDADSVSGFRAKSATNLAMLSRNSMDTLQVRGASEVVNVAAAPPPAGQPGEKPQNPTENPVQVRNDFRATVLWQPDVITDKNGTAVVKVKYPDSLTTWSATARVASAGNQFGYATSTTHTKQPLIVRLEAPRFLVVGDQVTISAVINNNTDKEMTVSPSLNAEGVEVDGRPQPVKVAANSEARVDWSAAIQEPGNAKLKVTARGDKYADSMENTIPIYEHGLEKLISKSGKLRGDDVTVRLDIPKERKAGSTNLTVQIAPSMAVTMLDALPYLINYPYGCTEQTMSRFLPAAITAKTLRDMGLKPEVVMSRVFGGIDQSVAGQTHYNPRRDLHELDDIEKKSLDRLYGFQHSDGGWGWWKDGQSDHYMTAYVIWGFSLARDAGIDVHNDAFNRGIEFLDKTLVDESENYDEQAWMLHALAASHASLKKRNVSEFQAKAFQNLWNNREKLNAYTRALLALSAHNFGYDDRAKILVENLVNGVKLDTSPDQSILQKVSTGYRSDVIGTAHWGSDGIYWRWSDGGVESTSFALRAFLAIDPNNKLIEPIVNWLVKNRRGTQWRDTRDTAITVLALADYLKVSGEAKPNIDYDLIVNGNSVTSQKLTAENAFSAPSQFTIDQKFIRDGMNDIRLKRSSGSGALYFSANATFFSQEEPITASGNELFVRRDYYKLVRKPTLLKGLTYDRVPLRDGETVESGERVEVVLTVEAKNDYEYLLFEDLKPAGLEAVQIQSGDSLYAQELRSDAVVKNGGIVKVSDTGSRWPTASSTYTGRSCWVYEELRDRKVALFIDKMPEGYWELHYTLRAEAPGRFHALPVTAEAMYVPEIRANGTEQRIIVK